MDYNCLMKNSNIYISVVILLLHMFKKSNREKVLEVFFDNPLPKGVGFQLREISRKIGLAPKSVKSYLDEFKKDNLIIDKKHRIHQYPVYYANRDNKDFKFLKKLNLLKRINNSGLIDYLDEKCNPEVIILFGSASKGEDLENSDVDIFLQSDKKELSLDKYEKKLNRRISIFFEPNFNKLSKELKLNMINGHKLSGYLNVDF